MDDHNFNRQILYNNGQAIVKGSKSKPIGTYRNLKWIRIRLRYRIFGITTDCELEFNNDKRFYTHSNDYYFGFLDFYMQYITDEDVFILADTNGTLVEVTLIG